jgi:hypothetical protein
MSGDACARLVMYAHLAALGLILTTLAHRHQLLPRRLFMHATMAVTCVTLAREASAIKYTLPTPVAAQIATTALLAVNSRSRATHVHTVVQVVIQQAQARARQQQATAAAQAARALVQKWHHLQAP